MIKKFLYAGILLQVLLSETYNDRIRVYIDNSIKNFEVNASGDLSNNDELNTLMVNCGVEKIEQWLPNALPTDRDGEVYLNRYYMIYFSPRSKSLQTLKNEFNQLKCIDHVELVTVHRTTYTPNDPYWNNQYGLELIQADLAYDLWDIDGGDI